MIKQFWIGISIALFWFLLRVAGFGLAQTSALTVGGLAIIGQWIFLRYWGNSLKWFGWAMTSIAVFWIWCWFGDVTLPKETPYSTVALVVVCQIIFLYVWKALARKLRRNFLKMDPRRKNADDHGDHGHDHGHGH